MKNGMLLLVAGLLAVLLSSSFTLAKPEATHLGLNSIDRMKPNGEYVIYTFKDGKWLEAGSLSFDKFFRERTLDLDQYLTGNKPVLERSEGTVKIRLLQKGGGAAHIDSVFLGGMPPAEVIKDTAALKKVSKKDYDVIDAFEKNLELVFPANVKDKTLSLTARVEGKTISKTPFQFPSKNLFRQINEKSSFYTYKLNFDTGNHTPSLNPSRQGRETSPLPLRERDRVRGRFSDEVSLNKPFFKEYSRTGSGHPSGVTYGWVRNDDENLYVKIDFTPDNTMDGEKDYAKVYVKTDAWLKEFKVSVPETKWGKTAFTYTDKVAYQHKVYDFKIPLSELGIKDAEPVETQNNASIRLAFAAYGTAVPGDVFCPPSIAYDNQNNRYLIVYGKLDTDENIYGQFVNPDGTPSGTEFVISNAADIQVEPSVAYCSAKERFLVAWEDQRSGTNFDIYGQLVNAAGLLNGTNFVISNAANDQAFPSVACDSANQRFLVTWQDQRGANSDIYGELLDTNGVTFKDDFIISNAADDQFDPSVAYCSAIQRFLVAWMDERDFATKNVDVYGQVVKADGTLFGTTSTANFIISNASNPQFSPSVACDSVNDRFLVAWRDFRPTIVDPADIYGQLVTAGGTLFGVNFPISDAADDQVTPSVAFCSTVQRYLVVWDDRRNVTGTTDVDIYGQLLNSSGSPHDTLSSVNFPISTAPDDQRCPSVAYNSNCRNFLVAFVTEESSSPDIGLALVGALNCPPEDCTNGIDDDGDGLVDCDDTDCGTTPETLCANGKDDDCDGLVDCDDPDCATAPETSCANGKDDDCDGLVDCDDPDCFSPSCPEICDDGKDNDGDGDTDCADSDCLGDSDGDGFIVLPCGSDCNDGNADIKPGATEICDDGWDNDCDGLVNCDDPDCAGTQACICQCDYDSTHPAGCISGRMTFGSSNLPLAWRTVKLVKIRPKGARVKMKTLTGGDGCYRFPDLYNGKYKIIVKCGGKRKKQKRWITDEKRVNRADFWCKKN